jgi:hypothetical protein
LGAGGVGVRHGRAARATLKRGAEAVGVVVVGDDAGGLAGEGLRFRGQEVARVVGIVAFRNAVVDGFQQAINEGGIVEMLDLTRFMLIRVL